MSRDRPDVVIIGGGVSGLLAVRHLKDVANVVVYEARNSTGGLWSQLDKDSPIDRADDGSLFNRAYGCHFKNIYDNLVLNIPSMFSQFKDFPHADDCPSFLTREQYADYIERYAREFQLLEFVRFSTFVLEIRQTANLIASEMGDYGINPTEKNKEFVVRACDSTDESKVFNIQADHVIIANGHNNVPDIPLWQDSLLFSGDIMHSHDFRRPDDPAFVNKTILVVGAAASGLDMLVQFFENPILGETDIKKMYLCGKTTYLSKTTDFLPWLKSGKLELIEGRVSKLSKESVKFTNGTDISGIDTIVLCTGYKFAFPFLEKENLVYTDESGKYFGPLYKRTFCINNPQLCFIGNMDRSSLMPKMIEIQCLLIKNFITGSISLPSKREMMADLETALLDFPGEKKKEYLKPGCEGERMKKIWESWYTLCPDLRKYEKLTNKMEEISEIICATFSQGNLVEMRNTEYRDFIPDFEWDRT